MSRIRQRLMRQILAPSGADVSCADSRAADEYLTVAEVAGRLKLNAKTVRNRMHDGTWQQGLHWFSPRGLSPRFKWMALVDWLETPPSSPEAPGAAYAGGIPCPSRGRPKHGVPQRGKD